MALGSCRAAGTKGGLGKLSGSASILMALEKRGISATKEQISDILPEGEAEGH